MNNYVIVAMNKNAKIIVFGSKSGRPFYTEKTAKRAADLVAKHYDGVLAGITVVPVQPTPEKK